MGQIHCVTVALSILYKKAAPVNHVCSAKALAALSLVLSQVL